MRKWKWSPVTTILFSTHDRITQIPISGDFWVMCRFSSTAYLKSLLKCLELNRFSSTNFTFFLTDASNTILLPMGQSSRYTTPGYDAQSSEILFSGFPNPLHLSSGQELRMWYEEDLKNDSEFDNGGTSCADVFVKYLLTQCRTSCCFFVLDSAFLFGLFLRLGKRSRERKILYDLYRPYRPYS